MCVGRLSTGTISCVRETVCRTIQRVNFWMARPGHTMQADLCITSNMKTTFILSTLFAATAFAAFHAVELPQLIPPGTGGGKMARRGEAGVEIYGKIVRHTRSHHCPIISDSMQCDRNTECAGVCNEITGCAKDQEDYCNDGESPKRCRCAVRPVHALLSPSI